MLLFEAKLFFLLCLVQCQGLNFGERNFLMPIPGDCSILAGAEGSQRLRNLWAFLRPLLRVLESCQALHHRICDVSSSFPAPWPWGHWRDPLGTSWVPLHSAVCQELQSKSISSPISLSFLRWNRFTASIYGTNPSCNCCRIIFVVVYWTLHCKTHDLPLPFSTLKNACTESPQNPGSAAWQDCLYPQRSCLWHTR